MFEVSGLVRVGIEEETYRKLTRRLIPFLMLCYVIAYLDRINVGFAKLQMSSDLGFSEKVFGFGAGIFFLGYVLFPVPSNLLMYRVGARRWIGGLMITWGAISGSMVFVSNPTQFFALRFLLGLAESGFYPGIVLYLTQWFPNERRAQALSLFQASIALAGIIGGPLSGWILDYWQGGERLHAWQWLFLLEALPAILAGVAAIWYLDNGIADARWLSPEQKSLLEQDLAHDEETRLRDQPIRPVFSDLRIWGLGIVVFGLAMGIYAISFWMPTLLHESGLHSNIQIGWLSTIPNAIAAVGMVVVARSSDARRERRLHVAGAAFVGAAGLLGTVLVPHHPALVLSCLTVAAVGVMSALPLQWTFLTAFLGGSGAAAAIGLINSVGNLGGMLSPAVIGWFKDRTLGFNAGIPTISACVAVSAIIALSYPARLVNR
jgi:MFS family permease